jgi:hypothetical protein
MKSYAPLRPRGKKTAPPWATGPRHSLRTDDAEFDACFVSRGERTTAVAWKSNGKWFTVDVQNKRIKSCQRLS